jgi:hypothetical protein
MLTGSGPGTRVNGLTIEPEAKIVERGGAS